MKVSGRKRDLWGIEAQVTKGVRSLWLCVRASEIENDAQTHVVYLGQWRDAHIFVRIY